jgi:DNA/RNA-binding domain of Phe-tRNA-synthetase-like protein
MMRPFPPDVTAHLTGWELAWLRLTPTGEGAESLAVLRDEIAARTRERWSAGVPTEHPTVAAIRKLFRAAGTDPTRYRPSSEALLRRVLKGDDLPAIHPLVDLNNLLSLHLLVPCCVIDADRLEPPLELRVGRAGERMDSMRGPFGLEGKPLLADTLGPFGTPITDSERVMVREGTGTVWLVAYLPEEGTIEGDPDEVAAELLAAAPVAILR